jgi:DNA polymerase III sliding clamp (beta) subunit (PCNA family)
MEIVRSDLVDVLSVVRRAVKKDDAMPLWTHLVVDDGCVQATDGEIGIAAIFEPFAGMSFMVPAARLCQVLSALSDDVIDIRVTEKSLIVQAGEHKSMFPVCAVDEGFPPIWRSDLDWKKVPAEMAPGLVQCQKTVDPSKGAEYGGISWESAGLVSTDTEVITWCPCDGPDNPILLSRAFVREAVKLGEPERWALDGDLIVFDYENIQLIGTLLRATFPEHWRSYFPDETPEKSVSIEAVSRDALKRAGSFSETEQIDIMVGKTKALVTLDNHTLTFDYQDANGSIIERVDVDSGERWKFRANMAKLAFVMNTCDRGTVVEQGGRNVFYLEGNDGRVRMVMSVEPVEFEQ